MKGLVNQAFFRTFATSEDTERTSGVDARDNPTHTLQEALLAQCRGAGGFLPPFLFNLASRAFVLFNNFAPTMKSPKVCYSIDWLQVYCKGSAEIQLGQVFTSPRRDRLGYHRDYKIAKPREFVAGYEHVYAIMFKDYHVATIGVQPRDKARPQWGCALKIANPVLYVADWFWIYEDILLALGWTARNITRIDLAADFNKFCNNINPDKFIAEYVSEPTSSRSSWIRRGSNEWCVYGRKDMNATRFNSIRWGSRQSGVSTYMYCKSLELQDKKYKPWIVDAWERAGLHVWDADADGVAKLAKVWRVEISISSRGLKLKDRSADRLHTLFTDDVSTQEEVVCWFQTYARQYFQFCRLRKEDTTKRKRDLKPTQLLPDESAYTLKPTTLYTNVDSGRTERLISRHLHRLEWEVSDKLFPNVSKVFSLAAAHFDTLTHLKHARRGVEIALDDLVRTQVVDYRDEEVRAFNDLYAMNQMKAQVLHWGGVIDAYASRLKGGGT